MVMSVPGPFGPFVYTLASGDWWWSDGLFRIHGFEPGDVVPTTEFLVAHKHPEDAAVALAVIERTLTGGEPFALWHRIIDAHQRVRQVVSVGDGVYDETGTLVEIRGHMVDVTESMRTETSRQIDEAVRRSAESRAVIEQAKGAIVAACGLTVDEAFEQLREHSQRANVKVRDLARQLVDGLESRRGVAADAAATIVRVLQGKPSGMPAAGAPDGPALGPAIGPTIDPVG